MNLLIVDDQSSVISGLLSGLHFEALGIDQVYTANDSISAKKILSEHPVHLMLCDVEMPGENGLVLNGWARQYYPNIIRLLLTSHSDFSYARKSVQLECFDYIVQPAPYEEIEEALKRAVAKYEANQKKQKLESIGKLYQENQSDLSGQLIQNLFSSQKSLVDHSIILLNQIGYPIHEDSFIQVILFDTEKGRDPSYPELSPNRIQNAIQECMQISFPQSTFQYLLTRNQNYQYVLLLFSNSTDGLVISPEEYKTLYHSICTSLTVSIPCYVSQTSIFSSLQEIIKKLQQMIENNISSREQLFFASRDNFSQEPMDVTEYIKRWSILLDNAQYESLQLNICAYLDFIASISKANFKTLCNLHQQLTQLFFNCAFSKGIDISILFTDDFSYTDYMSSYKNVDTLKGAISFLCNALAENLTTPENLAAVTIAKTYILNNIAQNITVKDVADHVHLTPEYFTKIFKKETGQSLKSYILQIKINTAKDLLANPNIPISLVSLELGYTNFSHFSQMFKKYESMTPSEYRKKKTN